MSIAGAHHKPIVLGGLDGTNPLGFLTALGTLVVLHAAGEAGARLRWERAVTWAPTLEGTTTGDSSELSRVVAAELVGRPITAEADAARVEAQRAFDKAKKAVADKRREIRDRGLRGDDSRKALETEMAPLQGCLDQRRDDWLNALAQAVPSPELALGKRIDPTVDEYRDAAQRMLTDAGHARSGPLDMLAAFGSDACTDRYGRTEATPFCFVTGSGHQFFLDTVRELIRHVTPGRVQQALFEPWQYTDEKLSLRWDPAEDSRYALTAIDPSDTASRTVWMANLLAYRSLALFPSIPRFGRLRTTGWHGDQAADFAFTWPIWETGLDPHTIRSLLLLPQIDGARSARSELHARGVVALFRSRRIKVGSGANFKVNFTRARAV